MYLSDIYTIPINIAGNGGLSLPVGHGETSGLPIGVQIIGPQFRDENIIQVAAALEATYDIVRLAPLEPDAAAQGQKRPQAPLESDGLAKGGR
jgi:aspartyl-tRNA(Asn)/glutamyl-tRNA(Gln) amidotransferase subunit A